MPFQPGQSGNPKGNPKRAKLFSQALLVALKRTDENDVEAIQRIADRMVKHAVESENFDVACVKEIADRVEGKVPQAVVGDDEMPDVGLRISWISRSHTNPEASSSDTTTEPSAGPAS